MCQLVVINRYFLDHVNDFYHLTTGRAVIWSSPPKNWSLIFFQSGKGRSWVRLKKKVGIVYRLANQPFEMALFSLATSIHFCNPSKVWRKSYKPHTGLNLIFKHYLDKTFQIRNKTEINWTKWDWDLTIFPLYPIISILT